jgi:hypothetical protein
MDSIFKMAILRSSIRLSLVFSPFLDLQSSNLLKDYVRINDTFGFFDLLSMSSETELRLGPPCQIEILLIIFHHFLRIFRSLLSLQLIQCYILVIQII